MADSIVYNLNQRIPVVHDNNPGPLPEESQFVVDHREMIAPPRMTTSMTRGRSRGRGKGKGRGRATEANNAEDPPASSDTTDRKSVV